MLLSSNKFKKSSYNEVIIGNKSLLFKKNNRK